MITLNQLNDLKKKADKKKQAHLQLEHDLKALEDLLKDHVERGHRLPEVHLEVEYGHPKGLQRAYSEILPNEHSKCDYVVIRIPEDKYEEVVDLLDKVWPDKRYYNSKFRIYRLND